jgi:Zn-dependent protease/predicted transcriptional regulator
MSEGTGADRGGTLLPGSFSLGRVAGVPLRVHWSVVIIMALIAWGLTSSVFPQSYPGRPEWAYVVTGVAAAVVFLLALLAHEAAHAVVARRDGVQVQSITLWLFGGVAQLDGEADDPGAELRIAGAGPLVSLLLGLAFLALAAVLAAAGVQGLLVGALSWLAWINLLLAVFNVLPGAPLDGGRLLRAALWKWRGDRAWAAVAASRAGRALGMVLIAVGLAEFFLSTAVGGLWLALVGWFVLGAAGAELRSARLGAQLAGVRVGDVMTPFPDTAPPDLSVAEFVDRHLFAHRHSTFPLAEHGRPVGLVTLNRVRTLTPEERYRTSLAQIACPMSDVPVASPGEPLTELIPRLNRGDDGRALVLDDDGHLIGIVSPADVTRAIDRAAVRSRAPAAPGQT